MTGAAQWSLVLLDSLKTIGIDLEIKPMVWPDMVAACAKPETFPDFFPVYQTANYGDPDNIAFAAYHSSRNGNWQNAVYANPEVVRYHLVEMGLDAERMQLDQQLPQSYTSFHLSSPSQPVLIQHFDRFLVERHNELAELRGRFGLH